MENFDKVVFSAMNDLIEATDDNQQGNDISVGIGEIEIKGINYQIQLQLIADKNLWLEENAVRYQQATNIMNELKSKPN